MVRDLMGRGSCSEGGAAGFKEAGSSALGAKELAALVATGLVCSLVVLLASWVLELGRE
jgi:hypothetical protein